MGLTVKDNSDGQNYEPVPAGMHHGVCYAIYDLGTQYSPVFNKTQQKVLIIWEIPSQRIEIEKEGEVLNLPRVVSRIFTASLNEKAHLRKILESWRGKEFSEEELSGFHLGKLLGVNCTVQIIHKKDKKDPQKVYANVENILPKMDDKPKIKPENETRIFEIESFDIPPDTPEWIEKYIHRSQEFQEAFSSDGPPPDQDIPPVQEDDEIPF